MRLIRYEDYAVEELTIDLHSRITVIRGLPRAVRQRIIETVEAIPAQRASSSAALIEAYGVVMDLTPENLALLDLGEPVDVVISPADLPATRRDSAPSLDAELESARQQLHECEQHYEQLLGSAAALRRDREILIEDRLQLARHIEAARDDLDSFAEVGLREARDELATLDRMAGEVGAEAIRPDGSDDELAQIQARIAVLEAQLNGLLRSDASGVRNAYTALKVALEPVAVPSADAQRLAEELEGALRRRLGSTAINDLERRIDAALAASAQARQRLIDLERASRTPPLDEAMVEELEATRDEIFTLERSKRTNGRSRRRAQQLHARQDELLAKLGFASFPDYLMGRSAAGAAGMADPQLEDARITSARAEASVSNLKHQLRNLPERLTLDEQIDAFTAQAVELLGHDGQGDLPSALRRHTTVEHADPAELERAVRSLHAELLRAGATVDVVTAGEVELAAQRWLEGRENAGGTSDRLHTELSELQSRRDSMRSASLASVSAFRPDLALQPRRDEAAARVESHAARLGKHQGALSRLADLRLREESLSSQEQDLERRVHESDRMLGQAAEARQVAQSRLTSFEQEMAGRGATVPSMPEDPVAAIEWYVLARLAQQRAISYVGSVPLVIDDAFAGWDFEDVERVHDRLERMSEAIQIIYFSDEPDVLTWARSKGDRTVAVVEFGAAAAYV